MQPRQLDAVWLGRRAYAETYELQLELHDLRRRGTIADTLLLLEHTPTITLGRGTKSEHLLASPELLSSRGVTVVQSNRGGDITLHGPGQLVAYPIVDLNPDRRDVRKYVQLLSETMRRLVRPYGVDASSVPNLIGLWADAANPGAWPGHDAGQSLVKLGAIGVRLSRWVAMHGFALNLLTDMSLFELIVPCGISEFGVTSVHGLTGKSVHPETLAPRTHELLTELLGRRLGDYRNYSDELSASGLGLK